MVFSALKILKRMAGLLATLALAAGAKDLPFSPSSRPAPGARVVVVQDAAATETFRAKPDVVEQLVGRGILQFTGQSNAVAAWRSLVNTNERVGIKVYSGPGSSSGTRVPVVAGVVRGLIDAGVAATNIVVWDRRLSDLRTAGFGELEKRFGIRLGGSIDAGFDAEAFYESPVLGTPVFGDLEFGQTGTSVGRKSYITKLVTRQVDKIISVASPWAASTTCCASRAARTGCSRPCRKSTASPSSPTTSCSTSPMRCSASTRANSAACYITRRC
jgi:hypothetical protein